MKVLFISRAYPPVHGGIEDQNYSLGKILKKLTDTEIIANRKGKKNLPFFLLYLFFCLPFILHKYDIVLFGDGVLSPLGALWGFVYRRQKFVSIVHGLDITFAYRKSLFGRVYRLINIPSLGKLDKLIMVGNHTIKEAVQLGISKDKCVFIPNGINVDKVYEPHTRSELEELLAKESGLTKEYFKNKKIILRVGRFVPHKGLHWFIDKVMPKLSKDFILVGAGGYNPRAVGDGENFSLCQSHIKEHSLAGRVILFPNISQNKMNILFNTVDLCISPNVEVAGSMEGFGLNVLEAVVCGRLVLAADLQGLKDAIEDGVTGFLLKPGDSVLWRNKIEDIFDNNFPIKEFTEKARKYVLENFTWEIVGRKYLDLFKDLKG